VELIFISFVSDSKNIGSKGLKKALTMGPDRHYRVTRFIQVMSVPLAFAGAGAIIWLFGDTLRIVPCAGIICTGAATFCLVILLGTIPKRIIPARCPGCGRYRSWIYSDTTGGHDHWKYWCPSCRHVHDTGVVWTYPDNQY
jgi:hypothetical protein